MDYISKEIKRVDELIASIEKKQDTHREALTKLQHQLQQAHVKAAMQAWIQYYLLITRLKCGVEGYLWIDHNRLSFSPIFTTL